MKTYFATILFRFSAKPHLTPLMDWHPDWKLQNGYADPTSPLRLARNEGAAVVKNPGSK
jgi:hypothetical protein